MTHTKPTSVVQNSHSVRPVDDRMVAKTAIITSLPTVLLAYVGLAALIVFSVWWAFGKLLGSAVTPRELIHDPNAIGVVVVIVSILVVAAALVAWVNRARITKNLE